MVGDADVINRIRATLYSGGSQIQGAQALEVLRGLVFAPVMHAVQAGYLNGCWLYLTVAQWRK